MTGPIYAIGDIHGQRAKLETALARIEKDGGAQARVVFVGDYCDRGPDSKGVVDILARGLAEGRNWICLKGNHDRMFEWFAALPEPRHDQHMLVGYHWLHERIGGIETLASYEVEVRQRTRLKDVAAEARTAVPEHHKAFLQNLKLFHAEAGMFFVHAGVRPGVPLEAQDEEDLVWIREEFLFDPADHGALIVHGHTPVDKPERHRNRVNLDTGAGYGKDLTTAVFEDGEMWTLGRFGRKPLRLVP